MEGLAIDSLILVWLAVIALSAAMYLLVREVGVIWENFIDLTPIFVVALGVAFTLIALISIWGQY